MALLLPFAEYWWLYAGFTAFVLVLLALDLGVFHRHAHAVSFRESVTWSVVWVATALAFNYGFYLYAAGTFLTAGDVSARNIARWDGAAWASLGAGLDGFVAALAAFDDGSGPALYAGGSFSIVAGGPLVSLARWNGSLWSAVGEGEISGGTLLVAHDDGSGPALFIAGSLSRRGSVIRWDGSTFRDLEAGTATVVRRDRDDKVPTALSGLASTVPQLLDEIQASMLADATARRDDAIVEVETVDEAVEAAATGFARLPWEAVGREGEARLAESAITVRCLQTPDGGLPVSEDEPGNVAFVGTDVAVQVSELEYWGDAPVTIPADPRLTFTRLTVRGTRVGTFASGQTYGFQDLIVTDDASLGVGGATVNLSGDLSTDVGGELTGVGVDLGSQILAQVPAAARPQVEPFIGQIVDAIHQAFSLAIANAMWLGVIGAVAATVIVALLVPEMTLRRTPGAVATENERAGAIPVME